LKQFTCNFVSGGQGPRALPLEPAGGNDFPQTPSIGYVQFTYTKLFVIVTIIAAVVAFRKSLLQGFALLAFSGAEGFEGFKLL